MTRPLLPEIVSEQTKEQQQVGPVERKKKVEPTGVFESVPKVSTATASALKDPESDVAASGVKKRVFESNPVKSKAAASAGKTPDPESNMVNVIFESEPVASKAHTSESKTPLNELTQASSQGVFENVPTESIAEVSQRKKSKIETTPTVFESNPTVSNATASASKQRDSAAVYASRGMIFESSPEESSATAIAGLTSAKNSATNAVFESEPTDSRANASATKKMSLYCDSKRPQPVFENNPTESRAAAGARTSFAPVVSTQTAFESVPEDSHAHASGNKDFAGTEYNSVANAYENAPAESTANAKADDEDIYTDNEE